jgi:hypothetical protein
MAIAVKKVTLWRKEVANDPGLLADVLEPLSDAGANLRVVMGYAMPGDPTRAAIEVFPISGKRLIDAAKSAGLHESEIACLLVEGDDRAGLGASMAGAIARENVNISFVVAETIGRRFSAVFGFQNDGDAAAAAKAIKNAAKPTARRR